MEYVHSQRDGDTYIEIFMGLKDGNVLHLIQEDTFLNTVDLPKSLLHQMLQVCDYLKLQGIIHRDIKPENILYILEESKYTFPLADFGLSNIVDHARAYAGTALYMALELESKPGSQQTSEVDIYSLFVVFAVALNVDNFRSKPLRTFTLRNKAIQDAAQTPTLRNLRGMAELDPSRRATAGDLLDQHFEGEGRVTPRNQNQKRLSPPIKATAATTKCAPLAKTFQEPKDSVAIQRQKKALASKVTGKSRQGLAQNLIKKRLADSRKDGDKIEFNSMSKKVRANRPPMVPGVFPVDIEEIEQAPVQRNLT